jgi:hypothetical protein
VTPIFLPTVPSESKYVCKKDVNKAPHYGPFYFIANGMIPGSRNLGEFLFKCRLVLNDAPGFFTGFE